MFQAGELLEKAFEIRCIWAPDGQVLEGAGGLLDHLGQPKADGGPVRLADLTHPEDAELLNTALDGLADGRSVEGLVVRFLDGEGAELWLKWFAGVNPETGDIHAYATDVSTEHYLIARNTAFEETIGAGTWEYDLEAREVSWSPMIFAVLGLDPRTESFPRPGKLEFFPEPGRTVLSNAVDALLADGTPFDLTLPLHTFDGRDRQVWSTGNADVQDGVVKRVYGTMMDVTDLHERLTEREDLAAALERISNMVVVTDNDQRITWANRAFQKRSGYMASALKGMAVAEVLLGHAADGDSAARLQAVIAAGQGADVPLLGRNSRGEPFWVELDLQPVHRATGEISGSMFVIADVTARVHHEARLRAAEKQAQVAKERLEAALEFLPDGFVLYDQEDRLVQANSAYRDCYRASAPAIKPGATFESILRYGLARGQYSDAIGREEEWLAERLSAHREPGDTHEQRLSDGRVLRIFEAKTDDGMRVGLRADITELYNERTRAQEANRTKTRFLANMSHEIRTPLNGVLGMAAVLDDTLAEPEQQKMVGLIRESGEYLLRVLNDILDLSKIEAGQIDLEDRVFVPSDSVGRIQRIYALKAEEKGVTFTVDTSGCSGGARRGDEHRFLQILHNLLSNAFKFTERGDVALSLSCRPGAPVEIEVRDTGIGMSAEEAARLFEPFAQGDSSTTRKFGGTGLGMSIVRELLNVMEGQISVRSAPGQGTVIRISLPLAAAALPAAGRGGAQADPAQFRGLRALVAEDNRTNQLVLGAMLRKLGVQPEFVDDGGAAVAAYDAERFDLMIFDFSMPVMDGAEALTAIRSQEAQEGLERMPAVVATANALTHQVEEYLAHGFDAHLPKPFTKGMIAQALASVMPGAAQAHAAG